MNISERIRSIRERQGLTQEDMAERFNVTRSNYAYLEGRGDKLTIQQLKSIADVLGVGIGELLGGDAYSEETGKLKNRILELEGRIKERLDFTDLESKWRSEIQILFDNYFVRTISDFAKESGIKHTPPRYDIDFSFLKSISDADMERIYREKLLFSPLLWHGIERDIIVGDRLSSILNRHRNGDLKDVPSWDDPSVPSYADTSKQK